MFSKKYILIPVNKKDHWLTIIIVNLPSLLQVVKADADINTLPHHEKPYILIFDPLLNFEYGLDTMLRLFMEAELKECLGPAYDIKLVLQESAGKDSPGVLITEHNLPHFQLIVGLGANC